MIMVGVVGGIGTVGVEWLRQLARHPDTQLEAIAMHRPDDGDAAVIRAVVDNLVKGASGPATQAMRLTCGVPETTGHMQLPVLP